MFSKKNERSPLEASKGKPLRAVDNLIDRSSAEVEDLLKRADRAVKQSWDFIKNPIANNDRK